MMEDSKLKRIYYVRENALQSIISDCVSFGLCELRLPGPGDDTQLHSLGRSLVCDHLPADLVGDVRSRQG